MTVTHTISKTRAKVRETVTVSTSGLQGVAYHVMWVANYTSRDGQYSFAQLKESERNFADYDNNNTSTLVESVTISSSHLNIKTLTPIYWAIQLPNPDFFSALTSAISNPIENNQYVTIGETIDVSFYANLAESVYSLGEKLATNIEEKGVSASADDGLTTLANKIDSIYANTPRVIIEDDTVTDFADLRFTVIVPKNCTYIVGYCFQRCQNLKYCILPEGITRIGIAAFEYCDNLKELIMPSTVTTLNNEAMRNIPNLEKLKFKSIFPPTSSSTNTFRNLPTTCVIEVPIGSLKTYKNASNYPDPSVYTYRGLYYVNDFSDSSTISDFTDTKGTITKSITNGELALTAPNNDEHLTYCNKAKLPKGDWKVTINSTTYDFLAVKIGYDPLDSNATVFDCTWNYGWSLVKINSDWSQTTVRPTASIHFGTTGVWVFEYIDKVMKIYKDNVLKGVYDLTSYDTIGGYVMIGDCCNRTNRISELIIEEL